METERPQQHQQDDDVSQLEPDVEDAAGRLPAGEAQDRRGPEPPAEDLLSET